MLLRGNADEILLELVQRVGPPRGRVREIAAPHQLVDADHVALGSTVLLGSILLGCAGQILIVARE